MCEQGLVNAILLARRAGALWLASGPAGRRARALRRDGFAVLAGASIPEPPGPPRHFAARMPGQRWRGDARRRRRPTGGSAGIALTQRRGCGGRDGADLPGPPASRARALGTRGLPSHGPPDSRPPARWAAGRGAAGPLGQWGGLARRRGGGPARWDPRRGREIRPRGGPAGFAGRSRRGGPTRAKIFTYENFGQNFCIAKFDRLYKEILEI